MTEQEQMLFDAAMLAMKHAYVPQSGFKVGAAALAENGAVYFGCNIENACLSITNCAERTAIFSAIAGGARKIMALLVVADTEKPVMPCGACRQVIAEFGVEKIIVANIKGELEYYSIEELLPGAFVMENCEDSNA